MRRSAPLAALALAAAPALAEVPAVLADTAPVHSLASIVMGDLGEPGLATPPGTSPHDGGLTPSQAQALSEADLVIWTGPAFLPWMAEAVATLAPGARSLPLLETEGWEPLPLRAGVGLGGEGGHEEHAHEEAGEEEGHAHEAGGIDPHAWLDPAVAAAWLGAIAGALAEYDPANAATYRANAERGAEAAVAMGEDLRARVGPLAGRGLAVGHDAYQYLERAAGLPANWAVARADGSAATAGDVASLRDAVLSGEVSCLLLDAEADRAWADTLGEGTALKVATVDPDGVFLDPGPALYGAVIEGLATALEECLAP